MTELITVQGTNKERRVILWEVHPMHVTKDNPTGEIFIAGEEVATVGKTVAVKRLLQTGTLVEAKGKTTEPVPPASTSFSSADFGSTTVTAKGRKGSTPEA